MASSARKPSKKKMNMPMPGAASSDLKACKMPKVSMPPDFKIRTQPLFSLPEEVLKLPAPKSKFQREKAEKAASMRQSSSVMRTYTAMRKARENFRTKLMNLICQDDDGEAAGDALASTEEKNMLRYYYYIRYGIDTVHVAPLDNKMILRVHNLISPKLKKWKETLFICTDEMREDFMMSMKKAIVDFVLKDPSTLEGQSRALIQELLLVTKTINPKKRYIVIQSKHVAVK